MLNTPFAPKKRTLHESLGTHMQNERWFLRARTFRMEIW